MLYRIYIPADMMDKQLDFFLFIHTINIKFADYQEPECRGVLYL